MPEDGGPGPITIDAHQHFWRYNAAAYAWIDGSMSVLKRDFLPSELTGLFASDSATRRVSASIAVEARQTLEETHWLLDLATRHPSIAGVVGYAPLTAPDFPAVLAQLVEGAGRTGAKLKGLRHAVQAEADPLFLRGEAFNAGIRALAGTGLVFDLLIRHTQLEEAVRFVTRHPSQSFVLDHCGKPPLAGGDLHPDLQSWKRQIAALAALPNVVCKLSGLVTEADWSRWTAEDLAPVWNTVLECFGPQRLLWGSDWPVATLATSYSRWMELVAGWLASLTADEQSAIWGRNAIRVYGLEPIG